MNRLAILAACATLQTGCASYHVEYEHISHLSAGWPSGPSDEEDTLDHVQLCGMRKLEELFNNTRSGKLGDVELTWCVGYKLRDGGIAGPRDTAAWRIKVPLTSK